MRDTGNDTRFERTELEAGRIVRFQGFRDTEPLSVADAIEAWQSDAGFVDAFLETLRQVSFQAVRWETPAVTRESLSQPFEFVCLDSPGLSRPPDRQAFASKFSNRPVVSFPNRGRDAVLVCPCPVESIAPETGGGVAWLHVRLDDRPKYYHHRPYATSR